MNAKGGSVDQDLELTVKVDTEEKKIGVGTFTTDYAQQEGPAGTQFSYTADLTNNSGENQTYSMSAAGSTGGLERGIYTVRRKVRLHRYRWMQELLLRSRSRSAQRTECDNR